MGKRILFVDDEANVLEGLRNLLRKQRKQWEMCFAVGAEAALGELANARFDVIVTDMRMPGMDGAALLQRVKELYPGVARLILSGYADRDAVVRALSVAHQYLSKPCDTDVLREAIERTCALQALLDDEVIRRVVGEMDTLPSVPRIYGELTRAVASPQMGAADIARIVETDPAMSVKVLQLANSAYFGAAQKKLTVTSAVAYLGVELLKALALTAQVFAALEGSPVPGFSLERVQRTSLLSARLAKLFVRERARGEEAFTAALVQDIGQVVLALGLPERYGEAIRLAGASGRPVHVVEKEVLGVTHCEVGGYLLGVWGLPFSIVEVVANHHEPEPGSPSSREVLAVVHVASALSAEACLDASQHVPFPVDLRYLERAGLAAELPRWRAAAAEDIQRHGSGA